MNPLMSPQTKRLVFIESFLGNFLFSICMLYGVSMTSAVNAGIIMAMIPAVVAVMSWMFLRRTHQFAHLGCDCLRRHWNSTLYAIKFRATQAIYTPARGRFYS